MNERIQVSLLIRRLIYINSLHIIVESVIGEAATVTQVPFFARTGSVISDYCRLNLAYVFLVF